VVSTPKNRGANHRTLRSQFALLWKITKGSKTTTFTKRRLDIVIVGLDLVKAGLDLTTLFPFSVTGILVSLFVVAELDLQN
jgi:hypothetical protein